jgi:hypothetical protein
MPIWSIGWLAFWWWCFRGKEEALMTELMCSPKIKPEHLARKVIVYLRQSSEKQVRYNLESQRLQYEVADRIRNLGWKAVEIIDRDLGCSAAMAWARREGLERVLGGVALGEVGIVGSREVSRLSRTRCRCAHLDGADRTVGRRSRHSVSHGQRIFWQ